MKKSFGLCLVLLMACSVLSGAEYTREEVLALFAKYNPSVLAKAATDEEYNSILQGLLTSYSVPKTDENLIELVALIRNFDVSLALEASANRYQDALLLHALNGMDLSTAKAAAHKEVLDAVTHIWAVTVQVQNMGLDLYKQRLKEIKADTSLSKEEKKAASDEVKAKIKALKLSLKNLKKYNGEQLSATADAYVAQVEQHFQARLQAALEAAEAENLAVTSKNKKPVAK